MKNSYFGHHVKHLLKTKEYRLGLEKRGEELHSSSRMRNSMGTGRTALFPKAGKERGEDRN